MKAYEVAARLDHRGKLEVPDSFLRSLPADRPVRLIALVSETTEEEEAWSRLTAQQFLGGYGEVDAIYDEV